MQNIKSLTHEQRSKARALLTYLGIEPTPDAVSRLSITPEYYGLEHRNFRVLDREETLKDLEARLLKNPRSLPSQYLALFLTSALPESFDFEATVAIAQALKASTGINAEFALREFIDFDVHLNEHIHEIVDQIGIEQFYNFEPLGQVYWQDQMYTIVEVNLKACADPDAWELKNAN